MDWRQNGISEKNRNRTEYKECNDMNIESTDKNRQTTDKDEYRKKTTTEKVTEQNGLKTTEQTGDDNKLHGIGCKDG